MSDRPEVSEQELAVIVVEHFRVRGYKVFQEVNLWGRCDIVGRRNRLAYAVEVKKAFNLEVLGQAVAHVGRAHGVYVAAQSGKSFDAFRNFCNIAEACGVGVLRIWRNESREQTEGIEECVPARITRWLAPEHEAWLRATLTPEHEALGGVAGSPSGSAAWTGFKQFQHDVWLTLKRHGPLTVREIATRLHADKKRFSSYRWDTDALARRAIHGYMSKGLLPCIVCVDDKRPAKYAAIGEQFNAKGIAA